MTVEVEQLTDELRRLVSHGATPKRLSVAADFPALWALVPSTGLTPVGVGSLIRQHLRDAINGISEAQHLDGRSIQAPVVRRCLLLELKLEGIAGTADARRLRVIELLGGGYGLSSWRRDTGKERELLHLLAEQLDQSRAKSGGFLGQQLFGSRLSMEATAQEKGSALVRLAAGG